MITERLAGRKAGCILTGKGAGETEMATEDLRGEIKEIRTKMEQVAGALKSLIKEIQEERKERKEQERDGRIKKRGFWDLGKMEGEGTTKC